MVSLIQARQHIQNFSEASQTEPHWGYADRVVPCVNDAGSCAYLDLVYAAHDVGMLYMGIMWAVIGSILLIWAFGRRFFPSRSEAALGLASGDESQSTTQPTRGGLGRLGDTIAASSRRYLLPESIRFIFGHTTRLQVAILAILAAYLFIFSFAGMYYAVWVTPVKGMPNTYNVRTTLGPWSDRVGVLAYALTPLSVLLSSRESILSLLTGVPYQSFMFLHRWLGWIIFAQSALHTIGWCIVEIRLYQPQPSVGLKWIVQTYMVYGLVAMILLTVLVLLSTKWAIRTFGYEFFRKSHYVLAMIYIGACIGHWEQLHCFLTPAIIIWAVDRIARLLRTALLHYNYLPDGSVGFSSAKAKVTHFADPENGDIVRLDFAHPQQPWDVGQHFFLCFPELSIWQSHPMTPLAPAEPRNGSRAGSTHSYVIRAKAGETRKLALLAAKKAAAVSSVAGEKRNDGTAPASSSSETSVILTGPYGHCIDSSRTPSTNILCVAGGTGITFVLPILLSIVRRRIPPAAGARKIELAWAIRHELDMGWVAPELDELRAASATHGVVINAYVTRESRTAHRRASRVGSAAAAAPAPASTTAAVAADKAQGKEATGGEPITSPASGSGASTRSSSGGSIEEKDHVVVHRPAAVETAEARRPHMSEVVARFLSGVASGSTTIFASGPLEMIGDLRGAAAGENDGGRVWKGEERFNVRLVCDDRVEW